MKYFESFANKKFSVTYTLIYYFAMPLSRRLTMLVNPFFNLLPIVQYSPSVKWHTNHLMDHYPSYTL